MEERRGRPSASGKENMVISTQFYGVATREIAAKKSGIGAYQKYNQAKVVEAKGAPELIKAVCAKLRARSPCRNRIREHAAKISLMFAEVVGECHHVCQ
ncbi:MAG: hypothetical protein SGI99_05615 [Pseudomonadota bacterium]|nr:hypothetical protein [Pseudomonadota bacterium]